MSQLSDAAELNRWKQEGEDGYSRREIREEAIGGNLRAVREAWSHGHPVLLRHCIPQSPTLCQILNQELKTSEKV